MKKIERRHFFTTAGLADLVNRGMILSLDLRHQYFEELHIGRKYSHSGIMIYRHNNALTKSPYNSEKKNFFFWYSGESPQTPISLGEEVRSAWL